MKRFTTILLAVIALAFSLALTGCYNGGTFTAREYSGENITSITIDVTDREIEVSASDDNELHIDYFESEKEYYNISVSDNNELTMTLLQDKKWTDYIGTQPSAANRKIKLRIPESLLTNLSITTTNEAIKLSDVSIIDSVSLVSNGGDIEFNKVDISKELNLTAKNGNIQGTIIGSYDVFSISCEIKKGECNLPLSKPDGEKALRVNCNNGNIIIDFVSAS